jgi:hypothetical protein
MWRFEDLGDRPDLPRLITRKRSKVRIIRSVQCAKRDEAEWSEKPLTVCLAEERPAHPVENAWRYKGTLSFSEGTIVLDQCPRTTLVDRGRSTGKFFGSELSVSLCVGQMGKHPPVSATCSR